MNDMKAPTQAEDAAWASLNTPLDVETLIAFCQDIERLYRINPMLEFIKWETLGDNYYTFNVRNNSQEDPFYVETELHIEKMSDGFLVKYTSGLKSSTKFKIEASPSGSKLTIIESYEAASEEERKTRLHEVDKSLVIWAKYLQKYLIYWKRWSGFAPWRWYMKRIWQPMKPMARRITYILLWISVVEVALIALGAAIYFVEYA